MIADAYIHELAPEPCVAEVMRSSVEVIRKNVALVRGTCGEEELAGREQRLQSTARFVERASRDMAYGQIEVFRVGKLRWANRSVLVHGVPAGSLGEAVCPNEHTAPLLSQ